MVNAGRRTTRITRTDGTSQGRANHNRSWPRHPLSLIFTFVLVPSLSLLNLYPRVYWGHINYYLIDEQLAHGWPLVYMQRDSRIANADMGGMYHGAWPFARNPGPIRQFRFDFLILDVVVAVMLAGLTITSIESLLQARKARTRFSLATILTITAVACIVLAIQRVFPLHWFALALVPNCVTMLSLAIVCFSAATRVYRRLTAQPAQH